MTHPVSINSGVPVHFARSCTFTVLALGALRALRALVHRDRNSRAAPTAQCHGATDTSPRAICRDFDTFSRCTHSPPDQGYQLPPSSTQDQLEHLHVTRKMGVPNYGAAVVGPFCPLVWQNVNAGRYSVHFDFPSRRVEFDGCR